MGKFGGALAELSAADLGVIAVRSALERAFGEAPPELQPHPVAAENLETLSPKIARLARSETKHARKTAYRVDELILGNPRPAAAGPNRARPVARPPALRAS